MKKYREWDVRHETHQTYEDFANYLGVSQPSISKWIRAGGKPPRGDNLLKLAEKLGYEIYDILGVEPPTDELQMRALVSAVPASRRAELLQVINDWLDENGYSWTTE